MADRAKACLLDHSHDPISLVKARVPKNSQMAGNLLKTVPDQKPDGDREPQIEPTDPLLSIHLNRDPPN
jgi:hypothetical protein